MNKAKFVGGIITLLASLAWTQQAMSKFDRDRALDILKTVGDDVRKHYYDPKFHGVNWDAKIAEAKEKIEKETSFNMAMSHIAAALDTLNDTHTVFLPPMHANRHDYGMQFQMIGERCFVTHVRPNGDAEKKGVKAGDEILTINGVDVNRDDIWKIYYVFWMLRPQPALHLTLADSGGSQRSVDVAAKVHEGGRVKNLADYGGEMWDLGRQDEAYEHITRTRYAEYGDPLLVIKLPEFKYLTALEVAGIMGKARKHQGLILDLRGNPGGVAETLKYMIGGVFDKEVKIDDRVGRKERKPEIAKPLHNPYTGKLVVLVDAESASAAEVFARVVQLEKRGVVMGDRSAGAVMEAKEYDEQAGTDIAAFYGVSITESDLIMTDGKSLEHTGVTPDVVLLPSPYALANGRDPVLARAAETLGVKVSPEEAGKAFPYEWPPE